MIKGCYKILLFYFAMLFIPLLSFSQSCNQYHIDNCRWADRTFLYSRQSRSAQFTPDMSSKFSIVVYKGEEYILSVDGERKLGDIQLRVLEEENGKQYQLYDNAEFDYEKYFYFKVTRTRKLIIEITTQPAEDPENENKKYCVGVLVEFRKTGSKSEDQKKDVGF
jgi:hypothetical protein